MFDDATYAKLRDAEKQGIAPNFASPIEAGFYAARVKDEERMIEGAAPIMEVDNKKLGKVSLFQDHISTTGFYKSLNYITSVRYFGFHAATNLVPTSKRTKISFIFTDWTSLIIEDTRNFTAFGVHKKLAQIYSYIANKTFQSRLNLLADQSGATAK